jgi:DNA ligase-1
MNSTLNSDRMSRFAETCEAIGATTKKNEKIRILSDYLKSLDHEDGARVCVFFTGRPFPCREEMVLAVGGSLLWQAIIKLTHLSVNEMETIYRKHGDSGAAAQEALGRHVATGKLTLEEVAAALQDLAARRSPAQKLARLIELFKKAGPVEVKYLIKIITGDLRIGLKEGLVEEAIAQACGCPEVDVRRANMLTGDIGTAFRLARENRLGTAELRLFHPIGFMLASPAESPAEVMGYYPEGVLAEDKYDGIRAQAHKSGQTVKLFSRTLDEIVEFPELASPLLQIPGEFILDGEILAWRDGPLPFTELQKRLGRKQPDFWLHRDIPVTFMTFDIPYCDGKLLLDTPLTERRQRLEALLTERQSVEVRLAPVKVCRSEDEVRDFFDAALTRGNEGVMCKAPRSAYTPGQRGRSWFKLKRPFATLDVVVTSVEYGHGKRRSLLSDFTFSVRDHDHLVTVGKAYSGLTDREIHELTQYFLEHTIEDGGFWRRVEPSVVIEVAFNNIQRSGRHESGYALRFPRIVRLRPDKLPTEIDTLDRVRELYEKQFSARRAL